jgi:hypothetical protein
MNHFMKNHQKSKGMTMVTMSVYLFLIFSLLLPAGMLPGAALAAGGKPANGGAVRSIQAEERMLLEGKDVFAYSSGELVALWKAREIPEGASIGCIGYEGTSLQGEVPGLHFPFAGFDVTTSIREPEVGENREALIALPMEETEYSVTQVRITDTGVPGPFGIEVGMTVDTLLSLLPEVSPEERDVATEGFDTLYTARYRDEDAAADYLIQIYSVKDMVSLCVITREEN